MDGFLKLDSATDAQGGTQVNVTIVTCSVDPGDAADVAYAPVSSAALPVRDGAQIQVLTPGGILQTVDAGWLVDHQVVNTPYFYYQEDAQHQITAMQEIYHP